MGGRSKYPKLLGEFGNVQELLDAIEDKYETLINKLQGEEITIRLLDDRFAVRLDGAVLMIVETNRTQFTRDGILIPSRELTAKVGDPNLSYQLIQPSGTRGALKERYERLVQAGLEPGMTYEELADRISELLEKSGSFKNFSRAVRLPILIPQMEIKDLGEATEKLVTLTTAAYRRQFPGRTFTNYRKGSLAGKINPFSGTGYEKLLKALSQGPVAGLWCPSSMLGYSLNAQREQGKYLPQGFTLTGTIEPAIGWTMYPDVVAASIHTPVYDCPAVQEGSSGRSFGFNASDGGADFYGWVYLADARDGYSGGLLFW